MVGEAVQIDERRRIEAALRVRGHREPLRPPRHGTRLVKRRRCPQAARKDEGTERLQMFVHLVHLGLKTRRLGGGDAQRGAFRLARHIGSGKVGPEIRSEEHTSELQSLMRISYAVFCLKKKTNKNTKPQH